MKRIQASKLAKKPVNPADKKLQSQEFAVHIVNANLKYVFSTL